MEKKIREALIVTEICGVNYPMIVPERNAQAVLRIEVWLELFNLAKELGLNKLEKKTPEYIR